MRNKNIFYVLASFCNLIYYGKTDDVFSKDTNQAFFKFLWKTLFGGSRLSADTLTQKRP